MHLAFCSGNMSEGRYFLVSCINSTSRGTGTISFPLSIGLETLLQEAIDFFKDARLQREIQRQWRRILQRFRRLQQRYQISEKIGSSKFHKPRSKARISSEFVKPMEDSDRRNRVPLAAMVSSCVRRWFQDTLREAKAGDFSMQVLVGQMYYSGYGVPRDVNKGRIWITRASKARASVWRVSNKHPGYNASDSDSDELKGDSK